MPRANRLSKTRADVFFYTAGVAALFLGAEAASRAFGSPLIFPAPLLVAQKLAALLKTSDFYRALGLSFLRILAGIALAAPLGILAGLAAGLNRYARAFLQPFFALVSATPVMSVILIAYLALGSEKTPSFTAFLMIFPLMAANTAAGIRSVDHHLVEMCALYRVRRADTLRFLYLRALKNAIFAGLRTGLALGWKVIIAAEVLVRPVFALGTGMQDAKAHLETAELFAWTLAAIIASAASDAALGFLFHHRERP